MPKLPVSVFPRPLPLAIKPPYLWGMLCKQAPAIMEFKHEFRITRRNVCFILPTGNVFINDLFAGFAKKKVPLFTIGRVIRHYFFRTICFYSSFLLPFFLIFLVFETLPGIYPSEISFMFPVWASPTERKTTKFTFPKHLGLRAHTLLSLH